jgi:hypothetical protein
MARVRTPAAEPEGALGPYCVTGCRVGRNACSSYRRLRGIQGADQRPAEATAARASAGRCCCSAARASPTPRCCCPCCWSPHAPAAATAALGCGLLMLGCAAVDASWLYLCDGARTPLLGSRATVRIRLLPVARVVRAGRPRRRLSRAAIPLTHVEAPGGGALRLTNLADHRLSWRAPPRSGATRRAAPRPAPRGRARSTTTRRAGCSARTRARRT